VDQFTVRLRRIYFNRPKPVKLETGPDLKADFKAPLVTFERSSTAARGRFQLFPRARNTMKYEYAARYKHQTINIVYQYHRLDVIDVCYARLMGFGDA